MPNTYEVTYSAVYYVTASSEAEAIEKAIEEHAEMPDGTFEAEEINKMGLSELIDMQKQEAEETPAIAPKTRLQIEAARQKWANLALTDGN